ncbi:MAG: Gluconokinase [Acidobacteriaceae bacterium]|nr:Gluconokinase [Acidobacteriaceae bacterium]
MNLGTLPSSQHHVIVQKRVILILMGVVGAGKTTVGSLLAQNLGWQFADADDFHPAANVEKIRRGIPLDDSDRAPWLAALRNAMLRWNAQGQNAVLACSALKRKYRDDLRVEGVQFVYLKGDYEVIQQRLRARHGHFASESILKSQFADLEKPDDAIMVEIDKAPAEIVAEIINKLNASPVSRPDPAQTDSAKK